MMPAKSPTQQDTNNAQRAGDMLQALVGEQVIHQLGRPPKLRKVDVRRLWEANYRVNILVGEDSVSTKIANSFFLAIDGDGNIVESSPKITRQYGPAETRPPLENVAGR
jgi:hypothetical protein